MKFLLAFGGALLLVSILAYVLPGTPGWFKPYAFPICFSFLRLCLLPEK